MKRSLLLVPVVILLVTCKKRTTINVSLFNPALNQFVPGATIALVERVDKMSGAECREIGTALTDAEGRAFFDGEKLRWEDKYEYFCAVTESWGIKQSYPCGKYMPKFISKGKEQDWEMWDEQLGSLRLEYTNLLSPSQSGDSITVKVFFKEYIHPKENTKKGGGYVLVSSAFFGAPQFPYSPNYIAGTVKLVGELYFAETRKVKMGVRTYTKQDFKVLPNQTFSLNIEW